MSEQTDFLRNHGDTIAIIASTIGVNIALAGTDKKPNAVPAAPLTWRVNPSSLNSAS